MEVPLPCFCCGKPLKPVFPDQATDRQPSGATTFSTSGHYGSGAFDPMDGSQLELNLCDDCLTAGKDRVRLVRAVRHVEQTAEAWNPAAG